MGDPARPLDFAAALDPGIGADVHRSLDEHIIPVHVDVEPGPDLGKDFPARHLDAPQGAAHQLLVGLPIVTDAADIHPMERQFDGTECNPVLDQGREQLPADIVHGSVWNPFNDFRLEQVDPRVDQGRPGLVHAGLFLERGDEPALIADHDPVFGQRLPGNPFHHDARLCAGLPVLAQRRGQVQVNDGIPAHHQEGVVEEAAEFLDPLDAPGRPEGFPDQFTVLDMALEGIADADAPAPAVAEIGLDGFGQVAYVHHDIGEAVPGKLLDEVFHHRFADDGNHRLGQFVGERPDPGALPGSKNHGFHRLNPAGG